MGRALRKVDLVTATAVIAAAVALTAIVAAVFVLDPEDETKRVSPGTTTVQPEFDVTPPGLSGPSPLDSPLPAYTPQPGKGSNTTGGRPRGERDNDDYYDENYGNDDEWHRRHGNPDEYYDGNYDNDDDYHRKYG
ncbi:hypothetical protein ACIO3O_01385 [Streptomyces sp. NPDC087440]|uniref:hypothetical protein n=1 Tax=Streptomyces sp. NPDC087440 TaxID=3365790 RepID=UPI00382638FE